MVQQPSLHAQEPDFPGTETPRDPETSLPGDTGIAENAETRLFQLESRAHVQPEDSAGIHARMEWLKGLVSLGRANEAVEEWDRWAGENDIVKENPEFAYWYAFSLTAVGQLSEAISILEHCLSLQNSPHESFSYDLCIELLVSCLIETGDISGARDLARTFIRRSQSEDLIPLMLHHLAVCQEERGEVDSAVETWQLLAESFPGTPEAVDAALRIRHVEESSPTPQPDKTTTEGTWFSIHLGSYTDQDAARRLGGQVEELGVRITYNDLEIPSGPLTTLIAGPFSSRRLAEEIKGRLVASLDLTGAMVIGPHSVSP